MSLIVWTTVGILLLAAVLGLVRVMTARDDASVAAVSDLVYFCAVGIFLMIGMASGSVVLLDVASLAALVGILATVSLARILTRGQR
ncbi:transporter [Serinicoccus sp. CNJ-927]|uniref:monovalent cation/H+ antiporter complex subunit F n=1 Tax=unclassified Serinicoccus TaxID=2643101 RepID=UPI00095B0C77|nr:MULTISPECIES: monovalent cation/H+ antiporter complex subunit F [unclassified Serinicoccus]OLT18109.1 transporter [Serinicoccus sp. CUA-874]OLT44816.1 transporter [Serinicoccus sp. CNJ-927]